MDEKYISVTKFKESLAKLIVEGGTEATRAAIARTLHEVVPQIIDDEPSADVQPVKHGRWECVGHDDKTYWYRCSVCGHEEHDNMTKHDNYCGNCGARMDGDTE